MYGQNYAEGRLILFGKDNSLFICQYLFKTIELKQYTWAASEKYRCNQIGYV